MLSGVFFVVGGLDGLGRWLAVAACAGLCAGTRVLWLVVVCFPRETVLVSNTRAWTCHMDTHMDVHTAVCRHVY